MPHDPRSRRHNLPAHRLRLIGRDHDLPIARRVLMGSEGRLLTLTGTGGCGKTRLALELADQLTLNFEHGVWLVELAGLIDGNLIPNAVASALDIHELAGESLTVTLVAALSQLDLLLVLDNCEHVIAACAQVVETLLEHCPRLRVLTTSREALRITGETSWRVPSLALPDPGAGTSDLLRAPAVQLFIERARATEREFDVTSPVVATVARICSRLDGLPLAIELAAARVGALAVEQIEKRLVDSIHLLVGGSRVAPTRQQTLRATLDWSYRLLSVEERFVFRRLAVFSESCDLEAIEAVCSGTGIARDDVLDLVQRLVDQSVVIAEEHDGIARYRLLEPVRQYAHGHLVSHDESVLARRTHALYYLAFGEARMHHTNVGGPRRMAATRELAREYPNIRGALAWAIETGAVQPGLRLAASVLFLWQVQGSVSEGLGWLRQLFTLPGADKPGAARGWALLASAWLANWGGDFEAALAACQESSHIAHRIHDPLLEWLAHLFWAVNQQLTGNVLSAVQHGRQAPVAIRAAKAHTADAMILGAEASTLAELAIVACDQADYRTALRLADQGTLKARIAEDSWSLGCALGVAGRSAMGLGALDRARSVLEDGLSVARQLGEPPTLTTYILDALGEVDTASGQPQRARAWLLSSLGLRQQRGERSGIPRVLDRLAALAASVAQPERALCLAGAADALYESLGAQRPPSEREKLDCWLRPLADAADLESADGAWLRGRRLDLDGALALALSKEHAELAHKPLSASAGGNTALTSREQEVAILLADGLTNRQIAARLVISVHTVQRHVENILRRLGFSSRTQIATWAVGLGKSTSPEADDCPTRGHRAAHGPDALTAAPTDAH